MEELTIDQLVAKTKDPDLEIARAARKGLWKRVRTAGRPGADDEKKAVVAKLIELLGDGQPVALRREVLWMLSEIGGDESVAPMAALIKDAELREDARMSLQRIPGPKAIEALQAALATVPQEFKISVAESLRARGVEVPGLPCQKLVPTKKTSVRPVGR